MIKKGLLALIVCSLMCTLASATPSLHFSTISGNNSWSLTYSGGWILTFGANVTEIDLPAAPDPLNLDHVNLPSMTLSNIVDFGTHLTADLTPSGSLGIQNGVGVMTATVKPGTMFVAGSTFLAYQDLKDDLDITSINAGYSDVIDDLYAAEVSGYNIDMSFVGSGTSDIYALLKGKSGSAVGGGSGNILAVPAPGAILLGGIGVGLVGWLKRRRTL